MQTVHRKAHLSEYDTDVMPREWNGTRFIIAAQLPAVAAGMERNPPYRDNVRRGQRQAFL